MSDHPSPCARPSTISGDCELETLAKSSRNIPAALRKTQRSPAAKMILPWPSPSTHGRLAILCDRCIRGCDEIKNNFVLRPHGQRLLGRHRLRSQFADGRFHLYFLRRVHGVPALPARLTNKSVGGHHNRCRSGCAGIRSRGSPADSRFSKGVSGTFSRAEIAAPSSNTPLPKKAGGHFAAKESSARLLLLHSRRPGQSVHLHSHRARQDTRRRQKDFSSG